MEFVPDFLEGPLGVVIIVAASVWSLVWKAVALYKAGKLRHKGWFTALFFINTLGILEILYVAHFSKTERRMARRNSYRRGRR
jgi:methionyl-tRNA synthetase